MKEGALRPVIHFLGEESLAALHATFLDAFRDYVVPMRPDRDQLAAMMTRRGVDYRRSVGAFDGGRMIAASVTGVGVIDGERRGHVIWTGVLPSHRGRGLAGEMIETVSLALAADAVPTLTLEVIQTNAPAVRAYRRVGFEVVRDLVCLELEQAASPSSARRGGDVVVRRLAARPDGDAWRSHRGWTPSWQNDDAAVDRAGADVLLLAAFLEELAIGHAVVAPGSSDLLQLAVSPPHRRRGVGTMLLDAARDLLPPDGPPLRVLNVDARAAADLAFYRGHGARETLRQHEMTRPTVCAG